MQEQKYKYFIDGKEVDNRTDYLNTTMSGDYVSYFDGDSVFSVSFSSFFAENKDNNKMIKREVNRHLADAINARLNLSKKINEESLEKYKSLFTKVDKCSSNCFCDGSCKKSQENSLHYSTRHKSQNGETHNKTCMEIIKEKQDKYYPFLRVNFQVGENGIEDCKVYTNFHTINEVKEYMKNTDYTHYFVYDINGKKISHGWVNKNSKIAEKENKTEENLVFQKDSEIHKEEGVKESNGKTDYSEIDWDFIEGLAKRMNKNKDKYEPFNYHKPMDVNLLKQSLLRHVIEILKGEHNDAGQEYGHLFAVALNAQMIYYQLKNNS